jgi:hypothetical protein
MWLKLLKQHHVLMKASYFCADFGGTVASSEQICDDTGIFTSVYSLGLMSLWLIGKELSFGLSLVYGNQISLSNKKSNHHQLVGP